MDRLRQLLTSINAQLSVLTVSQRMAIGLCAAMIVGSLLWLMQWSTTPDLVLLVSSEMSYDDLDIAEKALRENGVSFDIRGTRVFVRAADRHNALRLLHAGDALPDGSLFDMEAAVTDQNPFQSPEARAYAQNYAKGNELAKVIATYPFVRRAAVIVNPMDKRRIRGGSVVPTASVALTLRGGQEMGPEMVDGIARLVSGAVAGLKPHNVAVTDSRTGRSFSIPHPDDPGSIDHLAIQKKHESHLLSKIMATLAYLPGVMATVTVELDTSKHITQKYTHDDPLPKKESGKSSEQSRASRPTEPGVQANLGTALTAGGGGQSSSSEEVSVENFPPQLAQTETIEQMPFTVKMVTATVSIPRSFISSIYRAKYSDESNPNDGDPKYVAIRDEQIARVRNNVERIVMARTSDDVAVDVYPDMEWGLEGGTWSRSPVGAAVAQADTGSMDIIGLAGRYGPPAGLGVLAMMSLFMMSRIVRKSAEIVATREGTVSEPEVSLEDEPLLAVGVQPVGQVEATRSLLAGKEVDDETLRYQELGEEVARMVQEDPQSGAALLRRWVDEDR